MPEFTNPIEEQYGRMMDSIHRELWVFEGEGPPDDDMLSWEAHHQISGAIEKILDMRGYHDIDDGVDAGLDALIESALHGLVAVEMIHGDRGVPEAFKDEEDGDGSEQVGLGDVTSGSEQP